VCKWGNGVPECHVVQLDRLEPCLDRPSRREDLSPVPARLKRVQIARFRDMSVPPHDDAVAGQSAAPLQVHFGDLAGGHADPEVVVTLAERGQPLPAIRSVQSAGHPRPAMTAIQPFIRPEPWGMTDGEVLCCDSSKNEHASRHAREHAHASDRPVGVEPGEDYGAMRIRLCWHPQVPACRQTLALPAGGATR
jgi:hypothetical protein